LKRLHKKHNKMEKQTTIQDFEIEIEAEELVEEIPKN
jgi:hypothetical protein